MHRSEKHERGLSTRARASRAPDCPAVSLHPRGIRRERYIPLLLLAPALVVLLALTVYPLLYAVRVSFHVSDGDGWTLANYARLFTDRFFAEALWHTFVYAGTAVTVEFFLGLGLAWLLDRHLRGRSLFRALLLVPMMIPPVVVGVIWRLLYNPNFGAINGTLQRWGIDTSPLVWTASPRWALPSVILVDIWQWTPFMFLILLAGLQAIPQEPYEAALIDGSSAWHTFRHVTLPLLKPAILIALLLRTMDLLRIFDQIFILTQGGPGFATEVISLYIYKTAFRFFDFGYAVTMSFVLLLITNIISLGFIRLIRAEEGLA